MRYQLFVRFPNMMGSGEAPWTYAETFTSAAKLWEGVSIARARGCATQVKRETGTTPVLQEAAHA